MDPRHVRNLRPIEMAALAKASSRTSFVSAAGPAMLLVRIEDANGELALTLEAALEESSTVGGHRPEPTMGYDTVIGVLPDTIRAGGVVAPTPRAPFGGPELQGKLAAAAHYAAPLKKRPGASNVFRDRISVGRARTNDIVLRHHTVSKFHAWFECDEDGRFYLNDARSTNATLVNGAQIARSAPAQLEPGDELRFGDVAVILCPTEILWDALMVTSPASSRSARRA